MAITVNSEASDVGLCKNKILYQVTTDKYKDADGVAAVNRLKILSIPANGDSFIISWDGGEVAIECTFVTPAEAAADTIGTQIRDDQVTEFNVATVIRLKIDDNILIDEAFTISQQTVGSDEYVVFTAKAIGTKYNIETGWSDTWYEWEQVTPGGDDVFDGDFFLATQVFAADDAGNLRYLTQLLHKPLSDQSALIDVAPVLISAVDDFHLPDIGQVTEIRQTRIVREYRLLFFEKKPASNGSFQPVGQVTDKYAWFAGFRKEEFAQYPDPFNEWFKNGKKWLTWLQDGREVRTDQEHFISFINHDTTADQGGGGS